MSLTISRERVKARCGETSVTVDAAIDALIAEMLPSIQAAFREGVLANADSGLMAWFGFCATDIVCGEWLSMRIRAPFAADSVKLAGVEYQPFVGKDPADPFGLSQRGWKRLAPWLSFDRPAPVLRGVLSAAGKGPEEME